jgi:hypothetical protein
LVCADFSPQRRCGRGGDFLSMVNAVGGHA